MSLPSTNHPRVATSGSHIASNDDARSSVLGEYWELTKPRLSMLSVITAVVGYLAADPNKNLLALASVLIGTSFAAGAAGALNQYLEREVDKRMARTRNRPLPAGVISPERALLFGMTLAFLGTLILWFGANPLSAALVLVTLFSYLLVYTPLKQITSWNTIIGAVPGALPPLVGWAAARDSLGALGWVLFGILFCWQIPHFMAIAWTYRKDYADGGFVMATKTDPSGRSAGYQSIAFAALLVAISVVPCFYGYNNWLPYGIVAVITGGWYLWLSIRFTFAEKKEKPARKLFFASISYLPLVLAVFVVDRLFLI
ncbi:heme o synthase [Rubellicoccus peritrichatus]|uniref:Protoheme IX farnesyltransferase n=1 Tax=Rubellicoccus peritrichatus TaxID=3080537 RepID=A0AAQ3L9R6_9BACT|nr:heme o synthase [Puniceicoccus sp. CR14]WOO40282.1 heme o synthase [Puniceicoccus sp. CR14]